MRHTRGLLSLVSFVYLHLVPLSSPRPKRWGTIKLKIEGGPGPGFFRHLFSKSKTEWGDMGDWSGESGADTDNMKRVILLRVEADHVHPLMVSSIQERSNRGAGADGIVLCMSVIISQVSIFAFSVRAQRYSTKLAYTTTCNSDE
ncbi:hypothetical protein QR685DRAFT_595554 [Neurospora intermedia]|uniref:Secreted protein n=1 Tax=Neurospora intermedia TaxID=5142 RepID=A0ABR3DNG7_NEUIN